MRKGLAALALALGVGLGCTPAPLSFRAAKIKVPARPRRAVGCNATCWEKRAAAASEAGNDDVATVLLGRAYATEPSDARLDAWIGALRQSGQQREARRALDRLAGKVDKARIEALRASLGPAGATASVVPAEISPALRNAYAAEADGRGAEALAGFDAALAQGGEPALLAHLGDLLWTAGEKVKARRSWARARIGFDERGAVLALQPAHRHMVHNAVFLGEDLAIVRQVTPIPSYEGDEAEELEVWSPAHPERPRRRLLFHGSGTWASSGTTLLRAVGATVSQLDTLTGLTTTSFAADGDEVFLLEPGGASHTLVATKNGVELHDGSGSPMRRFQLTGTTPTIIRAYTGHGTHHNNILNDSPSWAESLALTHDARWIAIGGSDSKVRVFDMNKHSEALVTKPEHLLAYPWVAVDRRMMGANADLNRPLSMRFIDGGKRLVVVYSRGDIITWNTADGSERHHASSACSDSEASIYANRYVSDGATPQPVTAGEREWCAHTTEATLSLDGARAITGGEALRVRETADGKSLLFSAKIGGLFDRLVFSPGGAVGVVSIYGEAHVWSEGAGLKQLLAGSEGRSSPLSPALSPDGRFLSYEIIGAEHVLWDLRNRKKLVLPAGEEVLAMADSWVAVRTKSAVELRPSLGKAAKVSWPVEDLDEASAKVSVSGTHLLVDAHGEKRIVLVRELAAGRDVRFAVPENARWLHLSPDGKLMASIGDVTQIWNTESGAKVLSIDEPVLHVSFAPDSSFVTWINRHEEGKRRTVAHLRRIDSTDVKQLTVEGWSKQVVVSPNGEDVLVITENGMTRWRPSTHESWPYEKITYVSANHVHYSASADLLFFEEYDRVSIRRNDSELTTVGYVYPFLDGNWAVMHSSGAVDGSAGAPDNMVTRATGGGEKLPLSARLLYDRMRVPGLLPLMLAGAEVVPPKPGTVLGEPEKVILQAKASPARHP